MPNILVPLDQKRQATELIWEWQKEQGATSGKTYMMPPEGQLDNRAILIGVPQGAVDYLVAEGVPVECQ